MLIRKHSFYTPRLARDEHGFLLITKRWIIATGRYAYVWR